MQHLEADKENRKHRKRDMSEGWLITGSRESWKQRAKAISRGQWSAESNVRKGQVSEALEATELSNWEFIYREIEG